MTGPEDPLVDASRRTLLADESRPFDASALIQDRFREFAHEASELRKQVMQLARLPSPHSDPRLVRANLDIARVLFSKWSLEIMVILYTRGRSRFSELRKILSGISSRVLSQRLQRLERWGFVLREVKGERPPYVEYSLTPEGHTVSRLGEPVFLYLRLTHKMRKAGANDGTVVPATEL